MLYRRTHIQTISWRTGRVDVSYAFGGNENSQNLTSDARLTGTWMCQLQERRKQEFRSVIVCERLSSLTCRLVPRLEFCNSVFDDADE
jgi:hypothetical protein